jgi:hypothetical protein
MCTNIGATGEAAAPAGRAYIGSVSDDPYDIRTKVVVRRPAGGHAYVGTHLQPLAAAASAQAYSDSVSGAPTRGLNQAGLAFTWTLAVERKDTPNPEGAMKPHDVWAEVMTRSATVDEALELLENLPRGFAGAGMLADRDGRLALVEIGRKRINVTKRLTALPGGTAVNVNCWVGMQAEEGDPQVALDNPKVPNQSRYQRANELLGQAAGPIDLAAMARLLSDHAHKDRFAGENPWIPGHGYSICNHGSLHGASFDPAKPAWGTVSAEIIDPAGGVFWYTYGWPCGEAPEHGDQLLQERAWGIFIGFPIAALPAGDYTTLTGELTPLAISHLRHLLELDRATGQVLPRRAAA